MSNDLNKSVLNAINSMMDFQETSDGKRLKWFYCFGTLLEWIADSTFGLDYDIDIGCLYDECDSKRLAGSLSGNGYELESVFLHDVDKKPLNMHFKPTRDNIRNTPTVDIYFWIRKGNILYHTYDINKEGREIPREYTLKGVPYEYINPSQDDIDSKRNAIIDGNLRLNEHGVWMHDVFGSYSGYRFYSPFRYGSLLDEWYPDWRFRQYYKGQSKTRFEKKIKSFKEF